MGSERLHISFTFVPHTRIKEEDMNGRSRWLFGLMVVVAALIVGGVAYNAGMSQGLAMNVAQSAGAAGTAAPGAVAPVPYYWHRPWGFGFFPFGFFPFGFLLLWFLLA